MSCRFQGRAFRMGGLSLPELMVALVISLLVMGGVMQIFVSNRQSFRVETNLGRVQENSRYALEQLSRVVRMTGYQGNSANQWVLGPLTAANGGVVPLAGTEDDVNNSDTFTLIYRGTDDGLIKDCHGNAVAAATTVWNRFSLSANDELQCGVSTDAGTNWTTLVLVDGVEALHVLYGEDTDNDDSANRYVSAPNVADMDTVVSLRVGLLLVTQDDALALATGGATTGLLNEIVNHGADRRLRRVVFTTINLRNHL